MYGTGHLETFLSPSPFMKGDTLKIFHHFQYWVWDLEKFHGDQFKVLQKKISFPYSKLFCMTSQKKHPVYGNKIYIMNNQLKTKKYYFFYIQVSEFQRGTFSGPPCSGVQMVPGQSAAVPATLHCTNSKLGEGRHQIFLT